MPDDNQTTEDEESSSMNPGETLDDKLSSWSTRSKEVREFHEELDDDGIVAVEGDGSLVVDLDRWTELVGPISMRDQQQFAIDRQKASAAAEQRRLDADAKAWGQILPHTEGSKLSTVPGEDNWALDQPEEVIKRKTELGWLYHNRKAVDDDRLSVHDVPASDEDLIWYETDAPPLTGWSKFSFTIKKVLSGGYGSPEKVRESKIKPLDERIAWREDFLNSQEFLPI